MEYQKAKVYQVSWKLILLAGVSWLSGMCTTIDHEKSDEMENDLMNELHRDLISLSRTTMKTDKCKTRKHIMG
jgi:hypothetical protein